MTATDDIQALHRTIARKKHLWRVALYKSKLPASALRVGLCMVDTFLNRKTGALFPSCASISAECNLPMDTVKDGLLALKMKGLLLSEKTRFDGSPDYFLAIPAALRIGENSPVRSEREEVEIHPSNRWKSTRRTGENPPTNLRTEPGNVTMEHPGRAGSGTPAASLRQAPAGPLAGSADAAEDLFEEQVRRCL